MGRSVTVLWPPEENATITRLAFLAAKPQLRRRARPWWLRLVQGLEGLRGSAGPSLGPGRLSDEIGSERMASYAVACERAVGDLSVEERQALRQRGALPEWFVGRVAELSLEVRRARR